MSITWILKITALVYVGFGAFLYVAQRSLMYFPVPENDASDVVAEYLDTGAVTVKVWVVSPGKENAVIYFGGNAEDVYHNADDFRRHLPDRSVYLVNYRGYGGSGGSPTEQALYADALAVRDRLQERHEHIAVIGRSLGSGVATYLASHRPVERLVLATPHDSAAAVAQLMYPVYPVRWMLKDRYESVSHAPRITAPTLLLVAEHDKIISPSHSHALAAVFKAGVADTVVIAGAGHNGISGYGEYWRAIREFFQAR